MGRYEPVFGDLVFGEAAFGYTETDALPLVLNGPVTTGITLNGPVTTAIVLEGGDVR